MLLFFMFCNISEQTRDASNWRVMLFPVEKICHIIVVLATNYQRMSNSAFVIKKRELIDVLLKLIFIQMNSVECD